MVGPCLLVAYLGVHGSMPFEQGDTIDPGLYTAGQVIRTIGLLKQLEVHIDDDAGSQGVWVRRPTVVSVDSTERLEIYLRASGVFLTTVKRTQGTACLFASRNPRKRPPLSLGYRVVVVPIEHAKVTEVTETIQAEIDKREAAVPNGERTSCVAHVRSRKILLRYTSEQRLEVYRQLIAAIDVAETDRSRPKLERWRARSMKAAKLEPRFAAKWKEEGRAPLNVVVHVQSNSLLIRAPLHLVEDVRRILNAIDPMPGKSGK